MTIAELASQKYNPEWTPEEEKAWMEACEEMDDMERGWRENLQASMPSSEAEWLEVFPEAADIVPEKLQELDEEEQAARLRLQKYESYLQTIDKEVAEFMHLWAVFETKQTLENIQRQRQRFERLRPIKTPASPDAITDAMIETARAIPILEIAQPTEIKKTGKDVKICCPLHNEKTPSFHIYTEKNRWACYGCGQHGDAINLAMLLRDCSFVDAVRLLNSWR